MRTRQCRGRGALAWTLCALALVTLRAQLVHGQETATAARGGAPTITIADAGPGPMAGVVRSVLAKPHAVVEPAPGPHTMPRGESFRTSVVVLGQDATVASHVAGDVMVIGGDLFIRPGARIEGRAIAVGGGVYHTTLGEVRDGSRSFRDQTYDIVAVAGGYELHWRSLVFSETPFLTWPGFFGIRIPDYDRVNGLSLGAGPFLSIARGRIEVEPALTYRSHLGAIDPDVAARLRLSRRSRVEGWIGRETRSNERWNHSDPVNSLSSIWEGKDTRNYYRADGARATVHRLYEWSTGTVEPWVGAAIERARSVGPAPDETSAPWSVFNRRDREEGMLRPNPAIDAGTVTSALGGAVLGWESGGVRARGALGVEYAPDSPVTGSFVQTTTDARVDFPTFGTQSFRWEAHVVLTEGSVAPRQRWGWLGGSGTISTLDLLAQGGDHVFFMESRYVWPVERVRLPMVGSPTLMLRHMLGGAAVGRFPTLEQEVALRVGVSLVRAEIVVNPARRISELKFGVSLSR